MDGMCDDCPMRGTGIKCAKLAEPEKDAWVCQKATEGPQEVRKVVLLSEYRANGPPSVPAQDDPPVERENLPMMTPWPLPEAKPSKDCGCGGRGGPIPQGVKTRQVWVDHPVLGRVGMEVPE